MKKLFFMAAACLCVLGINTAEAQATAYEVVTASNDANNNELLVYDIKGKLLQTISTDGKGGVDPHIVGGGIAKYKQLIAVINHNSQSVSLFNRKEGSYKLIQVLKVKSKPVSLAFGHDHLYVLGTTTVESHQMKGDKIAEQADGFSGLFVGDGSAAQVGVLPNQLIVSERSNTIELVELRNGAVTDKIKAVQLPPPPGNDTPVGLVTSGDIAYVTIAHSDKVGIVKEGKLIATISSDTQHAPCWLTLLNQWLFCSNTPSKSITRYKVTEDSIAIGELVAAQTKGEPTDIDAEEGLLAALELGSESVAVSQFQIDKDGTLKLLNSTPTSRTANGIAIIKIENNS